MFSMTANAAALVAASNRTNIFMKPKARSISGTQCTSAAKPKKVAAEDVASSRNTDGL
jgi:hypothetical protein